MSTEFVQVAIVTAIAAGSAAMICWTVARPYFTTGSTHASCARCEGSGHSCAPMPGKPQLIEIQRRSK